LKAFGYTYVELDDGWQGLRDANGAIAGNEKFPDMKALVDYVHAKGLKFGLLTSAAPISCGGFEGSYGHEAADARAFAAWGVDYVVYDWCGAEKIYTTQNEMQAAYQKMSEALKSTGRAIGFVTAQEGAFNVAAWAPKTGANGWRIGKDIADTWQSMVDGGFAYDDAQGAVPAGRWNDPGLLQTGNGGMTPDEYRMQLNLWAVRAAPMMLGNDVRIMRPETVTLLTNREIIDINQDAAGRPGKRVAKAGQTEVWAKTLADGSIALGLFNHGNSSAPVAVSWEQLGIEGPREARDLWWHASLGRANNRYVVFLTGRTSLLIKLIK
jgi:alpha-galactosidase